MTSYVLVALGIIAIVPFSASGQSAAEMTSGCQTLAKLTEQALRDSQPTQAHVYMRAATLIRTRLHDPVACEAKYFSDVALANANVLGSTTVVIGLGRATPLPGWRHREIDELLKRINGKSPDLILNNLKFSDYEVDFSKLLLNTQKRKGLGVDLSVPPNGSLPVKP